MKKHIAFAVILGLAALTAFGQTAKFTAPKSGESWALDTPQAITWTWNGAANIKLLLFSQSGGSLGVIKSGMALGAGSYTWTVGTLENGKKVAVGNDYKVRILTIPDNTLLAIGPAFSIIAAAQPGQPGQPTPPAGQTSFMTITQVAVIPPQPATAPKPITIARPAKGDVWIPLKTHDLKWSWTVPEEDKGCGFIPGCYGCAVDVWLVPSAPSASMQKIKLLNQFCCSALFNNGMRSYSGQYSGIVPNIASGEYFIRIAYAKNPNIYGDSQPFTVKSSLSADTAYLGPDSSQSQVDLALTNVFFDMEGNLALNVRNMGDPFVGSFEASYVIGSIGAFSKPGINNKDVKEISLSAKTNEEKKVVLLQWGGYEFSHGFDRGKYIPVNTRPFSIFVTITATNDMNPSNNSISKEMCMIQAADIGTDGEIKLTFSPTEHIYINRGTSHSIHETKLKWLDKDTFEAEMEVVLWNYGSMKKTFDIWLYVDKLPGQLLFAGASLQPGYKMTWKHPVKIKVPSKCGDHRLVFIVDPDEEKNQPYPDSYMNNFINVTLKIACGGTITGNH